MNLVGELSLWIALLMAVWATGVSYAGAALRRGDMAESGERGIYAAWTFTIVASCGLVFALVTHDLSLRPVASETSAWLPGVYAITAFWRGRSGPLLFAALVLSTYAALAVLGNRGSGRGRMPWATGTLALAIVACLACAAFGANPFERLARVPADGRGMNPLLQNAAMAFHAPVLYAGFLASIVPFALTLGAQIWRRNDAGAIDAVQRWTLASWFFLTVGVTLGMWATYAELGQARIWQWSAVQTPSLLPWLSGTAFVYTVIAQDRRDVPPRWTVALIVATFLLSIFGAAQLRDSAVPDPQELTPVPGPVLVVAGAVVALLAAALFVAASNAIPLGRRRVGSYIVAAGFVLVAAAWSAGSMRKQYDVSLAPGAAVTALDPFGRTWSFTSAGLSRFQQLDRHVVALAITAARDGVAARLVTPEWRENADRTGTPTFEPSMHAGILHAALQDVYVVLGRQLGGEQVAVRVTFIPGMLGIWIGAVLLALGGLLVMWSAPTAYRVAAGVPATPPDRANAATASNP